MTKSKIILISCIIIIVILAYYWSEKENEEFDINNIIQTEAENIEPEEIIIHISGAVISPGIINLEAGERIADAIEKAGGCTEEADLKNVNLAYVVQDGTKIYIPSIGEENENIVETNAGSGVLVDGKENIKVNINTASLIELQAIPGVGETTAQKIIDYREKNGKFKKIEDLKNVSGIGEAKLANMEKYISTK